MSLEIREKTTNDFLNNSAKNIEQSYTINYPDLNQIRPINFSSSISQIHPEPLPTEDLRLFSNLRTPF